MKAARTPLQRRQAFGAALGTLVLASCGGSESPSAYASLAGLSLSVAGLSPAFASGTTAYTLAVANAVSSLTATPTAADKAATIRVNGALVASGGTSAALTLAVGGNTLSIVVTAEDGASTRTYTVLVTRAAAAASNDAALAGLAVSAGALSPAFDSSVSAYTVAVTHGTTSLTLTPVAHEPQATIRVEGSVVASGSASAALALAVGDNTLRVVVTAADGSTTGTTTVVATRAAAVAGTCSLTATETQGPYPLLAILSNSAMVRSDIREDRTGMPLTVNLVIQDAGCTPVSGAAVYIWHCDKDGLYSGYSSSGNAGQAGKTYLRGIQVTDAAGAVSFTTIYPGWYTGRITHIHVQVYLNDNLAVTATATTQLAFPPAVTTAVYGTALYTRGQNTSVTSFAADNVFSDGTGTELVTVSGDTASGFSASLTINIA